MQPGQNPDEVDVTETADQERDAKQHHKELQANRQEDVQLGFGKILIANSFGITVIRKDIMANIWDDDHNAEIDEGKDPEENAGDHCVHRSSFECVLDGKRHAEVAFNTDSSEAEDAVVDGHVEHEARQWAEDVRQVPDHVIYHFMHLKGQEDEEEQV